MQCLTSTGLLQAGTLALGGGPLLISSASLLQNVSVDTHNGVPLFDVNFSLFCLS